MDIIHQVVISNTPNFKSNSMFIDIIKPIGAKKCFVCVDKFNASYAMSPVLQVFPPSEEFEVHCNAIQNSYRYDPVSQMVVRSNLLDTFLTKDVVMYGGQQIAMFNIINNKDNWLQIDINKLPSINFTFVNTLQLVPGQNPFYNLHLKFKFE